MVFANAEGEHIDSYVLSHNLKKIIYSAGLRNIQIHDLRHTFASLMLLNGVAPKIISETSVGATVQ